MAPIYKIYKWRFDSKRWAKAIKFLTDDSVKNWAALLGVNPTTLSTWRHIDNPNRYPHPSMTSLLLVCNELDLDPRDFFVLETPEDVELEKNDTE